MNRFGLEPDVVWKHFEKIVSIPRPSGHEKAIVDYIEQFAKIRGFSTKRDSVGNLLVVSSASPMYENRDALLLQAHVDMVCEKDADVEIDFKTQGINAFIDSDVVKAKGTSLGADDGIGVAAMLAILENCNYKYKIGFLFTVGEEVGLSGAVNMDDSLLDGFSTLINLDSETEGCFFVGCAGGLGTNAIFNYSKEYLDDSYIFKKISISGLTGGHSGDDINKNRANAILLVNRLLWLFQKKTEIKLCYFEGGNLRNAIPRQAECVIAFDAKYSESFEKIFNFYKIDISGTYRETDPNLEIVYQSSLPYKFCVDSETRRGLICAIRACPNGVVAWDRNLKNIVETSTNIASIKFLENCQIEVVTTQRSSDEREKIIIGERVETIFTMGGADVEHSNSYPGWHPNLDSKILNLCKKQYINLFGVEPMVTSIHAGLECGLFLSKNPNLDMVSFGPTIVGVHSPSEKIDIKSVEKFWNLLCAVLENYS